MKISAFIKSQIPTVIIVFLFGFIFSCNSNKDIVETQAGTQVEYVYITEDNDINSPVLKISDFQKEDRSDREALQAMFDAIPERTKAATFDLQGKKFVIDGPIYYHKHIQRRTKIIGNNATIQANGDFDILVEDVGFGLKVGNGQNEDDIMKWMDTFCISDVKFVGGRNQLRLVGTLQSRIENCQFVRGYRGAQLIFCLQMVIDQCLFTGQKVEGLVLRSGLSDQGLMNKWLGDENPNYESDGAYFTNAKGSNCQSNRSIVTNSRFLGSPGEINLVRSQASDGIRIDNCIFEGHATRYSIYHDSRGSTTVKSFEVINPHIEHGKEGITEALIRAKGGAFIEITGMFSQYGKVCQIDADAGMVIIERPRWLPLGEGSFKAGKSPKWSFKDCDLNSEILSDPKTWVDGNVPAQAIQENHNQLIGLNKFSYLLNNEISGARLMTNNQGSTGVSFVFKSDSTVQSDLEHDFSRVFDRRTTLTKKGQGKDLDKYSIAGTIPVYAFDANGERRVVYWPYLEKK